MRCVSLFTGLSLLLISSARLDAAAKPPDVRTVLVARTQAWCGPSMSAGLYPTNVLHQGDRVQVVQELDGEWLAIRPPDGSFSWINERYVKYITDKYPNNYVVSHEGDPVPVLVGSSEVKVKPTKRGIKLERGTQVRVIGRAIKDSEGTWLPIAAPEGELRYVRKEDVSGKSSAPANATTATTASLRKTTPPPSLDGDALWRDADKAERTGRLADAIRLYQQAGDANLSVNPARSEEAYRRAHWLQQANTSTSAPGGSYFAPNRGASAYPVPSNRANTNAVRLIGSANSGPVNGQLVSTHAAAPDWMAAKPSDYVRGRLSNPSPRGHVNDRPVYLVVDYRDNPLYYVTAGPGIDLMSHVHQDVELWGSSVFDKDLRRRLLTVTHIRAIQ